MKRSSVFIALLATALCAAGAARAASVFRFSNDGNWGAQYASDTGTFTLYDYRKAPGEPAQLSDLRLDHPLAARGNWLIANDGVIWTIEGATITRRASDQTQTAVIPGVDLSYDVVAIEKAPASEPTPSAIFLQSLDRGRVQEIRCRLEAGLFQANGAGSLCKTSLVELPPGYLFPYLNSHRFPNEDDADYQVIYGFNPVEGNDTHHSSVKYYNGRLAVNYGWGDDQYGESQTVSTNGLWKIHEFDSELKLTPFLGKRPATRIAKASSYWTVSADGRYVLFELPRSGEANVVGVTDLDAANPAMRRVTIAGAPSGFLVSPNGKFIIQGSYSAPRPVAMFTDPYYGMAPELVVDVLMAKITRALAESRYADALPPLADIEAMGVPLDEDFYFYQADTLARAGQPDAARIKASAFVAKYGRKSSHYARMVEILAQ